MLRVACRLCRGLDLRRTCRCGRGCGRRSRRRRRGRDDALRRGPSRPEPARSAVATRTERRTLGLGRRRTAGHRPGLRAHERADVLRGVREEGHVARALERRGEHPLVLRARAALAARVDLAAITDVAADPTDLLEVDLLDLVHAEGADLAARPPRPAVAGTVAAAVVTAVAIAIARPTARAGVAARSGTVLAHLVSLEGDLVGVERARRRLVAGVRHRPAAHPGLAVTTAAEHLEVVAADVEARFLDVVLVRVRARAEAAVDEDLHAFLDVLLRDLRLPAPAAHAVPVGLLGPLAAAVRHAVHRDREVTDRLPLRGHAHLGIAPDVADDLDLGHRCHCFLPLLHSSRRMTM